MYIRVDAIFLVFRRRGENVYHRRNVLQSILFFVIVNFLNYV
jgi:hypothetical protein